MATRVLIGGQWGDEGKGKIVDVLTEDAEWIARFQGGNNAGHTVEIGDEKFVLHLIPSGILRDGKRCILGNGIVLDPLGLIDEIEEIKEQGVDPTGRLFISDRAHIVLPYHASQDAGAEQNADDDKKIGTTKRGIGPSYGDKINRIGLRAGDLLSKNIAELLRSKINDKNEVLAAMGVTPLDVEQVIAEYIDAANTLREYITDTTSLLNNAITDGASVLFEGAQGTMLDIDHGTYPFVTSSNATAGGACTGTGVAPNKIDEVCGVVKAYTTRVGEGPFATELLDETGEEIRRVGAEFGATTGRPRRCGWFDAVVAKYAVMVNGIDWWAITKMDVLDGFETIKICTAYELDGEQIDHVPSRIEDYARCTPVYEEVPGWNTPTTNVTSFNDLPEAAKAYVARLEELTGARAGIVSVGPKRSETMFVSEGASA